jgi:hypothetical protein
VRGRRAVQAPNPRASGRRPEDVFRRVPGVRPSDVFAKPGYPEAQQYWPTLLVVRDGQAVGRIGALEMGEEWKLLVDACPESGIPTP